MSNMATDGIGVSTVIPTYDSLYGQSPATSMLIKDVVERSALGGAEVTRRGDSNVGQIAFR
jgi:hypothetical protein